MYHIGSQVADIDSQTVMGTLTNYSLHLALGLWDDIIMFLSPFHSGCFGSASSELAKGAIAYRFHSEKLIRSLVN